MSARFVKQYLFTVRVILYSDMILCDAFFGNITTTTTTTTTTNNNNNNNNSFQPSFNEEYHKISYDERSYINISRIISRKPTLVKAYTRSEYLETSLLKVNGVNQHDVTRGYMSSFYSEMLL